MPRIACLGWGSLIWDPRSLPILGQWQTDGPMIHVEYVRQSNNGRMTLVLEKSATLVQSLWVLLDVEDLPAAREALREREGPRLQIDSIDTWTTNEKNPVLVKDLSTWTKANKIDAVVWTGLGPKFADRDGVVPTKDQVVSYLSSLTGTKRRLAEHYIRMTPEQIATTYRKEIVTRLGWKPWRETMHIRISPISSALLTFEFELTLDADSAALLGSAPLGFVLPATGRWMFELAPDDVAEKSWFGTASSEDVQKSGRPHIGTLRAGLWRARVRANVGSTDSRLIDVNELAAAICTTLEAIIIRQATPI